jgi:outer membrane protein OmpA-like peptidoglycan-associated protein
MRLLMLFLQCNHATPMHKLVTLLLLCFLLKAKAQTLVLSRQQVLALPCMILKNKRGDVVGGYYNQRDSSLYNCRGSFKKTLPGGFGPVDSLNCAEIKMPPTPKKGCKIDYLSSITFKTGSTQLQPGAKAVLESAAAMLKQDSACGVKMVTYVADTTEKKAYQLSWDRLNTLIKYMVEKAHVAPNRILFTYDEWGALNTADLLPTNLQILPVPRQQKLPQAK